VVDKNRIHNCVEEKKSLCRDTFPHKHVPPRASVGA
jgi:hypothetical protein